MMSIIQFMHLIINAFVCRLLKWWNDSKEWILSFAYDHPSPLCLPKINLCYCEAISSLPFH